MNKNEKKTFILTDVNTLQAAGDTLLIRGNYIGTTPASSIFCATFLNKFRQQQQHDYRVLLLPAHASRKRSQAVFKLSRGLNLTMRNPIRLDLNPTKVYTCIFGFQVIVGLSQ